MRLIRYQVENFRSVEDSGWIEVDSVTALIGANESGKTNLLIPLWKLNPANEGEIDLIADYPRAQYGVFREAKPQPVFIRAVFQPDEAIAAALAKLSGTNPADFAEILIARRFDGTYTVSFPSEQTKREIPTDEVTELLSTARKEISALEPMRSEVDAAAAIVAAIDRVNFEGDAVKADGLRLALDTLSAVDSEDMPKTSSIRPRFERLIGDIHDLRAEVSKPAPSQMPEVRTAAVGYLPKFVYYSNYGNLDSEIYLPHVIDNLKRTELGVREQAKARTLKVLFDFVRLSPQEILELGQDLEERLGRPPTPEELENDKDASKERYILLDSAATRLTTKFREWWKQGEYVFRFSADGPRFRIWVTDDLRPEPVELEGRSTGLQWFLSFYLVFLVESGDEHQGSILLLDEPGHSLHPIAQRDLSEFFEALAERNQLLYTTHSPFLVDANHLDRARKVFVDSRGKTKVTADLSVTEEGAANRGSGYAVHAAIGITIAESILIGTDILVVEGPSDQHYLSAMKLLLIAAGRLTPGRELVFPPAGGVKGVKAISAILGSRADELPPVLLDSDAAGEELAKNLREGMYGGDVNKLLSCETFAGLEGAEIEDLVPRDIFIREVDRMIRGPETAFADEVIDGEPVVPQVKAWAKAAGVELKVGWKVELAKRIKRALLTQGFTKVDASTLDSWDKLFSAIREAARPD